MEIEPTLYINQILRHLQYYEWTNMYVLSVKNLPKLPRTHITVEIKC